MIELKLKNLETYYINKNKLTYINSFYTPDEGFLIHINFGLDTDLYINCEDSEDFLYILKTFKNLLDS